jgi:hypothetical protein
MAYKRIPLSGSTAGRQIKVTGTATGSSVTIHTAQSGTALVDVVTLYAMNSDSVPRLLTIEWGGVTVPDDLIKVLVPAQGAGVVYFVIDGVIQNSLIIKAWAEIANSIQVGGFVNRESA